MQTMGAVKKPQSGAIVPATTQPAQLELFRLVTSEAYANAFDFCESIPRFMVAR